MEYVVELFCCSIIFGYLFYKWANKNYKCFSSRNVVHEKPLFLIGNNLTVLEGKESSQELLIRLHNQFKNEKIYGYYGFRSPYFIIRDPELIEKIGIKDVESFTNRSENRVLMSDETTSSMLTVLKDEKWIDMRKMLAPAFAEPKMSQVFQIVCKCNREAVKYLKETIKPAGTDIDVADYFHKYTNDIIASAAFGLEVNSYKDKENEFSNMATVLLRTRSLCVAVKSFYLTISPQVLKIYRLNRIYIKSLNYVRTLISKAIRPGKRDKSLGDDSIGEKKESEFFQTIIALLKKSSDAIRAIILTVFPQILIIFQMYGFVRTIRKYFKALFGPKSQKSQKERIITQDQYMDEKEKKNTFLKMVAAVLRKITAAIKSFIFTIFPQIILISWIFTLTKTVLNYLRGTSFRQKVHPKNKKLSKTEATILKFERLIVVIKLLILMHFQKISKFFKLNAFNASAINYMKSLASNAIRQRQDDNIIRHDMIHLILEAHRQENDIFESNPDGEKTSRNETTENELIAQCIMFLFSGFEPMTNMMCVTVYELMNNPEIQEKLYDEVAMINEELNGAEISYEMLNNMKYLDMVVAESLRKWPSVPFVDRVCSKPYTLTNTAGEFVADFKPGDIICFSVYGSHFDEDYFENPFAFDPERFSERNKSSIRSFTYFPFGVGARSCLGNRFGLMIGKIMLYHMVSEFKFAPSLKSIPDLFAARRRIQLKQSEFFWMKLFPRMKEETDEQADRQTE